MNKTSKIIVCLLLVSAFGFLYSQEVVEAIVAVVNDDIISLSDFKNNHDSIYQLLKTQYQGEEFSQAYKQVKEQLLESMITDLLLLQEAKKRNLDVTEQMRSMVANIKEENGFNSDEELKQAMARQGVNFDAWRKQQADTALRQNVIFLEVGRSIVVDDTDIVSYYKQNEEEFIQPEEYQLKGIYISEEGKTESEVSAKTNEIDEKIAAGEDFAALAGLYSEGPEKDSQGDLGRFKKGELEGTLEQAVDTLNEGAISPWISFRDGWYLLRLEERKEKQLRPFEDVRDEIEQKIYSAEQQKKLGEYLEKLQETSFVKILIPNPLDR